MQGWIKLHRELLEKPIWKETTSKQHDILIVLLLMANHKPAKWLWKGKLFECQSGQFVTSIKSINKLCAEDVSRQNIKTALKLFEELEFLTNESTKQNRLITIVNYKTYQFIDDEINQQINHQLTINQPSTNHQLTTNNNVNNVNNENNVNKTNVDFENFWQSYPNKKAKGAAFQSWCKIKPNKEFADKIINAVKIQKTWPEWIKDNGQFIPMPSTWLNQKRWDDELKGELLFTQQKTKAELSLEKILNERNEQ